MCQIFPNQFTQDESSEEEPQINFMRINTCEEKIVGFYLWLRFTDKVYDMWDFFFFFLGIRDKDAHYQQ